MYETFNQLVLMKMDKLISIASDIRKELKHMSAELEALAVEVEETKGIEESAVVLLQGLKARLDQLAADLAAAGIDNALVVELSTELDASSDALAAAVAAFPPA